MAEVLSTFELKYQDCAPGFELPDARGKKFTLRDVAGPEGTIVVFACNHCPFVIHLAKELGELAKEAAVKGVNTVVINSNDLKNYPQDGPEEMKVFEKQYGWDFPYLLDETQMIAKQYGAACTPDFYLFDAEGLLSYSGQFDDTRPGRGTATGVDLRSAVDVMLSGNVPKKGLPSSGCNIKWKAGNEPRYFG
ncbi:thioredoxin family protein [Luteolibacter sp. AS25]|uniref:thioredoxin family protein n=1 Tax=Luteolibacter sp. AS25 TaxID=3135776 RepID=UPI00398B067E